MRASLAARLRAFWEARTRRERVVLALAAALVALLLFDRGVWAPLARERDALIARVPELARTAAEAEALAARVRAGHGAHRAQRALLPLIEEKLAALGLRQALVRLRPQPGRGERFLLELRDAPFLPLVRFVAALGEAGVDTASLRLERAAPGRVHARLVVGR